MVFLGGEWEHGMSPEETKAALDSIATNLETMGDIVNQQNDMMKQMVAHIIALEERVEDIAECIDSGQAEMEFADPDDPIPLPPIGPLGGRES